MDEKYCPQVHKYHQIRYSQLPSVISLMKQVPLHTGVLVERRIEHEEARVDALAWLLILVDAGVVEAPVRDGLVCQLFRTTPSAATWFFMGG